MTRGRKGPVMKRMMEGRNNASDQLPIVCSLGGGQGWVMRGSKGPVTKRMMEGRNSASDQLPVMSRTAPVKATPMIPSPPQLIHDTIHRTGVESNLDIGILSVAIHLSNKV